MPSNHFTKPSNTPTENIYIHRHCMQNLLHEAINNAPQTCHGLLKGKDNIVKNNLFVTPALFTSLITEQFNASDNTLIGAYFSTDKLGIVKPETLELIHQLQQQHLPQRPFYYLILHMDHKGRIDAHMYADFKCHNPVTLLMREQSQTDEKC